MMSYCGSPAQKSPERAVALQKYLLLHYQHDTLQKHLDQISTSIPSARPQRQFSSSSSSSASASDSSSRRSSEDDICISSSPSPSPVATRHHSRSGSVSMSRPQRPALVTRRSSLATVIDESIIDEIEEDETKLKDVNLQIKGTLTELLNCESVRSDNKYRTWVQKRLMDAEMELKKSRTRSCERRRSEDVSGSMMI